MKNFITSKVSNKYFKNDLVQLMIPFCSNMTLIGPNGVMFHCLNRKILINEYLKHPKRNLFPYSYIPVHSNRKGAFTNQLLELNQPYFSIYNYNDEFHFRKDYLYRNSYAIFNEVETPITLEEKIITREDRKNLKKKYKKLISEFDTVIILDKKGQLLIPNEKLEKSEVESSSGLIVRIKSKEITANLFNIQVDKENITLETQSLILDRFDLSPNYDLENPEPSLGIFKFPKK